MKTYMVVYEGKTYLVKGKRLFSNDVGIQILDSEDITVAFFPHGSFVADKACIEEQKLKKPISLDTRII